MNPSIKVRTGDGYNPMDGKQSPDHVILELTNISKSFPGVKALDHISLSLEQGEIHALVGENGAGKSTLINIISGVMLPDEGVMHLKGQEVRFSNTRQAYENGIGVVHQERNLVPTFNVAENILLERVSEGGLSIIDEKKMLKDAQAYMDMVGIDVSPSRNVEELSVGKKQLIEIAKALSSNAQLLLLDEPTASISISEAALLFETIRKLKNQGVTFLYVSHKLEEIFEIADSVTVLRDGRNAGSSYKIKDIDRDHLVTLMVGRPEQVKQYPVRNRDKNTTVLEVKSVKSKSCPKENSFNLYDGEILGWYGLVGAGRTELAKTIIGSDPMTAGEVRVRNVRSNIRSVSEALHRWHIGYITENRQEEGVFLIHPITRNIASTIWNRLRTRMGFLDIKGEERLAKEFGDKLNIRTPSIFQLVNNLSGGNRQKVSFAKGLAATPEILFVDEPTVGIDIKTKEEIHELIWDLAQKSMSIILISSDMPEVVELADRLLVFREGKIVGEMQNDKNYESMSKKIMSLIVTKTDATDVGKGQA
jgi:ribose transport system ATP-binding protein